MTESAAAILALILGLCAVIAVTVWWPNPLDREAPEEPLLHGPPVPPSPHRDGP
ncbi:hypothetical protein [Nocardia neocaledoniensis]|uniref:hypothetical protein n=1 Tax=Nocardia neocaledoniensis TaxID=236511 RepID=UPI0024584F7F|nr:hypothetical protein [Nocardia neocaledoniensis]